MAGKLDFDWYLEAWMQCAGLDQAGLRRLTGWSKRKASELFNGAMRYNRDVLNEAAAAMHIAPFELLLHPDDAFALRRLQESAIQIAAERQVPFTPAPSEEPRRQVN